MIRLEVLIPHFNQAGRLHRALSSLHAQTRKPAICVVDNGSTDHTPEVLGGFPEVRCLRLDRNLGFGAALNRGVASSSAELLVFVNNDAVADPGFIEELVRAHDRGSAEMVAGCMRRPDGAVETLGVELDQSLIVYDYHHGADYERLPDDLRPPLAPSGGACLFERSAFLSVGGFDEAIFAYLEDAELGLRMRLAGMRCELAARAFVWHEHSATLGSRSAAKNELLGFSRGYILWKYGRSLGLPSRARGLFLDGATAAGKAVMDRDLGVVRGRLRALRQLSSRSRPDPPAGFINQVPLAQLGARSALGRRLGRRRPS